MARGGCHRRRDVHHLSLSHRRAAPPHGADDPDLWLVPSDGEGEPDRLRLGPFQQRLAAAPEGELLAPRSV